MPIVPDSPPGRRPAAREPDAVIFYGLTASSMHKVIEFYASREEAEQALREILADEPGWRELLAVVPVKFVAADSLN